MSLYQCIDIIDNELLKLTHQRINTAHWWKIFFHLFSHDDKAFLIQLKKSLENFIQLDNYDNLDSLVSDIENYIFSGHEYLKKNKFLTFILSDVKKIQEIKIRNTLPAESRRSSISIPSEYIKFQTLPYKIANLNQGNLYKLGLSKGECYGFTFMMADPEISPYVEKNQSKEIDLIQAVHDYQKHQGDRKKDQEHIKRTRLTREYFAPDFSRQAEKIYQIAKHNKDQELALSLRDKTDSHSCYVSMQQNKLRYADSNRGVYIFPNKSDFIEFYVAQKKIYQQKGFNANFYQVSKIEFSSKIVASETFSGKVRTVLTGNKYSDSERISRNIGSVPPIIIGVVIGAIIGSVFPIVGTALGAIFGIALGAMIGALFCENLSLLAQNKGHRGILGVPHFLIDTAYSIKKGISNFVYPKETKKGQVSSENSTNISSSFAGIMPKISSENSLSEQRHAIPPDTKSQNIITETKKNAVSISDRSSEVSEKKTTLLSRPSLEGVIDENRSSFLLRN